MRLIKKMIFSLIPPAALNPIAVITFPVAFVRPERPGINLLKPIERLFPNSVARRAAVAKPASNAQLRVIPLVKASTTIAETSPGCLKGKCVLCVGGQLRMYPAYRQIVEDAGGRFLSFHGAGDAALTGLRTLLGNADLIICPIDCVRHEAFILTKAYCEGSRKPCVMLDKSRVTTFYNGVRMLKKFIAE